jgi:hypothetical protein
MTNLSAGRCPSVRRRIVSPAGVVALSTQIIISLPVQTAVWPERACGVLVMLVALQLSLAGSYLPPVFKIVLS